MSFKSTFTVKIRISGSYVDFASRTLGIDIVQRLQVGALGRHTARLTFDNNDGALTPLSTGTYANVDWFSTSCLIDGDTGSYTFNACHGIITGFELLDDGVNSYVSMTIDDVFTCGGNAEIEMTKFSSAIDTNLEFWLEAIMNGTVTDGATFNRVGLPQISGAFTAMQVTNVGRITQLMEFFTDGTYTAVANDFITQTLAPSGPNTIWPTTIDPTQTYAYDAVFCQLWPLRNSSTAIDFTFDESPTSGELPLKTVQRGYTIDQLINTVKFTALDDGTTTQPHTVSTSNDDSLEAYGQRGMFASAIMEHTATGSSYNTLEEIAGRWANQYSLPEFVVRNFTIDEATVNGLVGGSAASEELWAQLLDVTDGICQIATLNFTPTGSSTQVTENVVMLGRQIQITPSNVRIEIECLPLAQAGGFTLDSDVLGVLDQNRLG